MRNRNVKTKKDAIKETVISILVGIIIVSLFFGIVIGIRETGKGKGNEKSCVVTDCRQGKEFYVVTIMDHDGNLWDYYDDTWYPDGYILKATFDGDEVIDVRK